MGMWILVGGRAESDDCQKNEEKDQRAQRYMKMRLKRKHQQGAGIP